jgi:conjugal transfer pilin signal peptidase TrbI
MSLSAYKHQVLTALSSAKSFLFLFAFIVLAFTYFGLRYSVSFNVAISDCLNSRIFLIDTWDKRVYEGQLIAFQMNVENEFYDTGSIWVKKVAAADGKIVNVDENAVTTDSQYFKLSAAYVLERLNREPETLQAKWDLKSDEIFMIGETLTSLDSRFWGPINRSDVRGRAYAIL